MNEHLHIVQTPEGFSVHIPAGKQEITPVQLYIQASSAPSLRNRIVMEAGSSASIAVSYLSADEPAGNTYTEDFTEVQLAENASLHLVQVQQLSSSAVLKTCTTVSQAAGSNMTTHYASLSGNDIRNTLNVTLSGEKAEHIACGLAFTKDTEHITNNVQIIHASPNCHSNQLFRHILAGKSTGNFTGRIVVNKGAQKTAAYQRSSNILLDNSAKMEIQPQLEIYADDVKCSHGATVGQLDVEALFYLQSRGIDKKEAEKILLLAFAEDVLKDINIQNVKDEIIQHVNEKLITY
ncbi:MAG: Fe-S cluster assembly protein SufD [Bacteroidales bacterium]|jgi:Fe-S cluster assembly protein SufD|nr:Fe-S cluster assembly protein SufD [Bacteroidales bacterium]